MIQVKCVMPLLEILFLYTCQSGISESNFDLPDNAKSFMFGQYRVTLVANEGNIEVKGAYYALVRFFDSITLTLVKIPSQGTNGKLPLLPVQGDKQYILSLPDRRNLNFDNWLNVSNAIINPIEGAATVRRSGNIFPCEPILNYGYEEQYATSKQALKKLI